MADTFYAWTDIRYDVERDKDGNALKPKVVLAGESVDAKQLGISDDDFAALVEAGSVRTAEFPEELQDASKSPVQKMFEINKLREGNISAGYFGPDVMEQLQTQVDTAASEEPTEREGKVTDVQTGNVKKPGT